MMESLSQQSESSDHTTNTPPRMRYPHPTTAYTPSSPSCSKKAASRGPCDSSTSFSLQDSGHRSIRVYGEPRCAIQQQKEGRPAEGDMGKILPQTRNNAMALNPSRWHMVVDKDLSPSSSNTSPMKRSKKSVTSAIQMKHSPHNRWASEGGEAETTIRSSTAERKRHSESQRLQRPTRKASGYRASRTTEVSTSADPTVASAISVPSVIAVETWQPRFPSSLSREIDSEMPTRRRSFDEIPTLPQRQRSNTSLGISDDFSSSSPTSI